MSNIVCLSWEVRTWKCSGRKEWQELIIGEDSYPLDCLNIIFNFKNEILGITLIILV